jgi:Family of unknown function (DUF6994)
MTQAQLAIDITFDFRSDTPPGGDPDTLSPTLRRYHRMLWSKALPGGNMFELAEGRPGAYLHHRSALGEFFLSSDSVIPSFRKERRLAATIEAIPPREWGDFMHVTYTIGGMMIFPGNRIDRRMTINGARGFHPLIKDRFDLTIECIRRHYNAATSPLRETLKRYGSFFRLFESFRGYVDFFLLQDMVAPDYSSVLFFTPFDEFGRTSPLPATAEAYAAYRHRATAFINARNQRVLRAAVTSTQAHRGT